MSERGVQGVIRRLEARGFIVTKANGGRRGSNHFTLHLPAQDGDPTSAPGAPEPLFNHQEPCERAEARGRVPTRGRREKERSPTPDGQDMWLRLVAEKLKQRSYVAPSAVRPDQARRMIQLGLVQQSDLRRAGIQF